MLKPTSQYPVAAAHLNSCLRASYVLGRDCGHAALRNMISLGCPSEREREREKSYPFASHFQTTRLSLTKTQGKSRAGWGAVEVPAETSMRIVEVQNFEASLKSPPLIAVPLEIP